MFRFLRFNLSVANFVMINDNHCGFVKSRKFYEKNILTLSYRKILDSSKLKEIAADNFKFDENDRKFSKRGRKYGVKRRYCLL